MATPDDALTRIQFLDRHAKDHAPFVETELRLAAGFSSALVSAVHQPRKPACVVMAA